MKWFKTIGIIIATVAAVIVCVLIYAQAAYGPHQIIQHHAITITLPFAPANEATNLIPMGETIEHPFAGGHPGIDFQWDHTVPLIAVAGGTITSINNSEDKGEPVLYLTLKSGGYAVNYKELEKVADGIANGTKVMQGDVIGYPHCHTQDGHIGCQVHWEFAYASFLPKLSGAPDRLCPLTYFDASSRARIDAIWAAVPATDRFKSGFPNICSNVYFGHDK